MKFIDLKTGETFDAGTLRFCGEYIPKGCDTCPMRNRGVEDCTAYAKDHPVEAARMMKYAVIEEEGGEIKKIIVPLYGECVGSGGIGKGEQSEYPNCVGSGGTGNGAQPE